MITPDEKEYQMASRSQPSLTSNGQPDTVAPGLRETLQWLAAFQRNRPGGDAGSYQRGYDIGFNNAALAVAGLAQAAIANADTSSPNDRVREASKLPSVEDAARIIDPYAFREGALLDNHDRAYQKTALAKATTILALIRGEGE